MALAEVSFPYSYYPDPTRGRPVFNGKLYFGNPNTDPEVVANQKQVKALVDGTTGDPINIAQPILTNSGGVPTYNGSPCSLFIDGEYSVKVLDHSGQQVYYAKEKKHSLTIGEVADAIGGIAPYEFDTVADAKTGTLIGGKTVTLEAGDVIRIKERGNALFDVISGTGAANGWNKIAHSTLSLTFVLRHDGTINIIEYGLIADGTKGAATGTDNSAALISLLATTEFLKIEGSPGVYYFGTMSANQVLASITTVRRDIDWKGAYLIVNADNSVSATSTTFIQFTDINGSMINYEFEDVGFNLDTSTGRGCAPFVIRNISTSTSGYTTGNCVVHKGNSLLQVTSSSPATNRAKNIKLIGSCTGKDVYYGATLSNNGDGVIGSMDIERCRRAVFMSSVRGCRLRIDCKTGLPASANVLINNAAEYIATNDNHIDVSFETLDGPALIETQPATATNNGLGAITNLKLDITVGSIGGNRTLADPIVEFKCFDATGAHDTNTTSTMDGIEVNLNTGLDLTNPIKQSSFSPNFMRLKLKTDTLLERANLTDFIVIIGDELSKAFRGVVNANSVEIPAKFLTRLDAFSFANFTITVVGRDDTTGTISVLEEFISIGSYNGSTTLNLLNTLSKHKIVTGGPVPTVTVDANGANLRARVDTYAAANGTILLSVRPI